MLSRTVKDRSCADSNQLKWANGFESLTFGRFRFKFTAMESLSMPGYKGSIFRGGFGAAFRSICCATRNRQCQDCILNGECSYSYLFETPNTFNASLLRRVSHAPHPFILRPPLSATRRYAEGDTFEAEMILVGKAIRHIPYVIYAMEKFGHSGIGRDRGKFSLDKVSALVEGRWHDIYSGDARTLLRREWEMTGSELSADSSGSDARSLEINLITPLRVKFGGTLSNTFVFSVFLTNIVRRIALLCECHCNGALELDFCDLVESSRRVGSSAESLRWIDWKRYSARQQAELTMGGMIGKIKLTGDLKPFVPYLKLGELVHVGKGTSMGMGMFTVGGVSAISNPQE